MSLRSLNNRLVLAGLLAIAVATVAVFVFVLRSDEAPEETPDKKAALSGPPLGAWSTDEATEVAVRVDSERGPTVEFDEQASVVLTPADAQLMWSAWTLRQARDTTHIVGKGSFGEASAKAVWTLVEGNPQAHLRLTLSGVPASRLASDITLTHVFSSGEAAMRSPVTAMPAGVARPAQWTQDGYELAFTNFDGDSIAPAETQDGKAGLDFRLWRPQAIPGALDWSNCTEAEDIPTVQLDAELTVTVGDGAAIARWSLAKGQVAAMMPVFDAAEHHPDTQLAQSAARDVERWLLRVRTLIYGHSSAEDPRYGNGGLLGHGLGGTVVVPKRFASDERVKSLAENLKGTQVELAPRAAIIEGYQGSSRFVAGASCKELVELARSRAPAVIAGSSPGTKPQRISVDSGPGQLPATVAPVQLDGNLDTLLTEGLSPEALEPLVAGYEIGGFSTPFVATRNPLVGAFKEALLEPERDGHWTVSADLASALADLAMWKEGQPLSVTSLADLVSHTDDMRELDWWWADDGSLVVFNPGKHAVHGATLAVPGTAQASLADEQPLASRVASFPDARALTLFWFDVEPGRHAVAIEREGVELIRPAPVAWKISAP